jgi:multidrug efflux pump
MLRFYERTLAWRCASALVMLVLICCDHRLNVVLYVIVPKGFFPQQDTGRMIGGIQADQSISFQRCSRSCAVDDIVQHDPAVRAVVGFTGGSGGGGRIDQYRLRCSCR